MGTKQEALPFFPLGLSSLLALGAHSICPSSSCACHAGHLLKVEQCNRAKCMTTWTNNAYKQVCTCLK